VTALIAGSHRRLTRVDHPRSAQDGLDAETATRRGHALVVAVDAAIHGHVLAASTEEDRHARIEDVVTLAITTLRAYASEPAATR